MTPINDTCASSNGWVALQAANNDKYIKVVPPNDIDTDTWVVKFGNSSFDNIVDDYQYHFLFEKEGYILNRKINGFLTVMVNDKYEGNLQSQTSY